jgi:transmembrane sensor
VLVAKESAWFSLDEVPVDASVEPRKAEAERRVQRTSTREAFLEHARHQRYANALQVIHERPSVVHDDPEDLMLAADAARLSGHAAEAVPYLERVAAQHARDARAPLAAFTLGRIYLFDLGRPLEAKAAFARTRSMSGAQGALSEDALAREAEAAARAGLASEASRLAQDYLDRYPQGRRRAEVAKFVQPR